MNNKRCLICERPRDTLYWHVDKETDNIWVYCTGKCQRGYSLYEYTHLAGVSLADFLKGDFEFTESAPNEVSKLDWPSYYIPLSDPRASRGVEYVRSRGLELKGDMYYDMQRKGIVFPYYYENIFVGAQIRLLKPWINDEGEETKMLTMPGTRLGLVFYNWNQNPFVTDIKGVIVCEGAFNTISLQQSLDKLYGGILKNPFKVIATSGCGTTKHQIDKLKELKQSGKKVIIAFDSDEPGLKGLAKMKDEDAMTHFALTGDTSKDWNDMLISEGTDKTAKTFIQSITSLN